MSDESKRKNGLISEESSCELGYFPDTFASRTAAIQDEWADSSIGNVTGSNAVNVFLGIGLGK